MSPSSSSGVVWIEFQPMVWQTWATMTLSTCCVYGELILMPEAPNEAGLYQMRCNHYVYTYIGVRGTCRPVRVCKCVVGKTQYVRRIVGTGDHWRAAGLSHGYHVDLRSVIQI